MNTPIEDPDEQAARDNGILIHPSALEAYVHQQEERARLDALQHRLDNIPTPAPTNGNGHAALELTPVPNTEPEPPERWTDLGNTKRLVARYGHQIRWIPQWGRWLTWDGTRWAADDKGHVDRAAKHVARSILTEAANVPQADERKKAVAWATTSESANRIEAMIRLARTEPGIPVTPDELDRDPWKLTVTNGTINLRTGQLHPHSPADLITKLADTAYNPDATCPTWTNFLNQVLPDPDLQEFFARAVGYSLTGLTTEQILLILWGSGANGKSTACEQIRKTAGDYALQIDPQLLTERDQHETGTARLKGARLAIASEGHEGGHLAEATVKRLTGGDRITARYMRQDHFEFDATHTLWMVTNHKPVIKGTDHAIWRRIRLIPFTVTIPDDDQDKQLSDKLNKETEGILAWAVNGAQKWAAFGLSAPTAVVLATAGYRAEMDTIGEFLNESTYQDHTQVVSSADLFESYRHWCDTNGERTMSQKRLGAALTERGFDRVRGTKKRWEWLGLGLNAVTAGTHGTHWTQETI